MKRIQLNRTSGRGVEINMSPLIDCVFLLLIFFIVTTVFVEETGVTIQKPLAASAREMNRHSLMIALTADERIIYGGRELNINSVRGLVSRQLADRDVPVIIMADSDARTAPLVALIDECKLAGAKQVNIAARKD